MESCPQMEPPNPISSHSERIVCQSPRQLRVADGERVGELTEEAKVDGWFVSETAEHEDEKWQKGPLKC